MSYYRHILLLILFILLSSQTFAEEYTFRLDTVFQVVKNSTYGKLRVIDMRTSKDNLGELKTGAFNRTKPIVTEKSLQEFLSSYYHRMIAGNRDESTELLLVLYSFEMIDRANGGEIGTFYFDGDFYGGSNNKYGLLGTVDSIYEATSGWDVTQALLRATKYKINGLLARYASDRLPQNADLTEQEALARRQQQKQAYPIYTATSFRKGIYYTAEQFLNNSPLDTPFLKSVIHPTGGKKQIFFYYANAKGKKGKRINDNTYFAIYDGKDWSVPGHFFAETMRYENGEFYANLPFRGVADKSSTVTGAGVMFGMVGAAIATAATSGEPSTSWGVYRARFDPETKTFVPQKRLN